MQNSHVNRNLEFCRKWYQQYSHAYLKIDRSVHFFTLRNRTLRVIGSPFLLAEKRFGIVQITPTPPPPPKKKKIIIIINKVIKRKVTPKNILHCSAYKSISWLLTQILNTAACSSELLSYFITPNPPDNFFGSEKPFLI